MKNTCVLILIFCAVSFPFLLPAQTKTEAKKAKNLVSLPNPANFGGCALMRDRFFEEENFRSLTQNALADSLINRPFGGAPLMPGDKTRELLDRSREMEKRHGKAEKKKN